MTENKNDNRILEHNYDGIREIDNPMPAWWLWSFLLTIMFGALYYIHYTSGIGPTLLDEYKESYTLHMKRFPPGTKSSSAIAATSDDDLFHKMEEANKGGLGEQVFTRVCQACHADHLQGLIGPNLTDEYWIHGQGKPKDILTLVQNGVVEKGMPAWGAQLKDDEVLAVVAYILSKRGSKPTNAKEPQGTAYPEYLTR